MNRQERMLKSHVDSLTAIHCESILKGFDKPVLEGDSVTSRNESKRIAHITRHLLTSEPTHSIILQGEHYERA